MGRLAWESRGDPFQLWSINRRSQTQARPSHLAGQGNVCTPWTALGVVSPGAVAPSRY